MPAKPNLDDYIQVHERIISFYEKYPEGSLRAEILQDDGKRIVMRALAYRNPEDTLPSVGHAEEIRGDGPVNRTSALENAETSAIGRAIAMFGFHVSKSVASRDEVENALAEEKRQAQDNGKPNLVTEAWVADARKRIAEYGETLDTKSKSGFGDECRMKLTALNAGRLEDLTPSDAAKLDAWLTEKWSGRLKQAKQSSTAVPSG